MKLSGRAAIVTGGASGIGAACARLFAAEGARVAVVDRDAAGAESVADEIRDAGGEARAFAADVTDGGAAERTVEAVMAEWRRIDALAAAAGVSLGGTVPAITEELWDRTFAINAKGTFLWAKAVLAPMIAAGGGAIVTFGSQLAFNNLGNNAAYIASKGAVVSFTRAVAVDHAADGIRVNAVIPGVIDTPMVARSLGRYPDTEARREAWAARHPMGRLGRAEEVARAALYLASDDSSFTTGSLLFVDGGWTAH